ncbi:MAG: sigma-70 family RNA polymerase sigma factor [Planctomycetes bacterium]|nr:sigma-70 family RNA polymerase sigma factor [Planctomycetota bacterium]
MDPLASQFDRFRAQGDLQALGAVFDALAPRLLPVAMHLTGRPADAEDALQQTFLLAMDRAASFDATRRLEPWLAGLLQNVVRNHGRLDRRRRTEPLPEVATDELGPLAAAEREELVARLRTHVDALPADQRQVLRLQIQHGLSPAQIAEALELPPGTVRMRLHRGLETLRKFLPAGLAALLASALPAQGLAAVKQFVLAAAKERLVAAAAATTVAATTGPLAMFGGIVAMKKLLVGVVLAALLGVCWWFATMPQPEAPRELRPDAAVPAAGLVADDKAIEGSVDAATVAARQPIDTPVAKADALQPGPTELWGRVVDAASKAPIADADVELLHRPADEFWNLDLQYGAKVDSLARARSGSDGTFRFDVVRARPHSLRVAAGGFATTTVVGRTGGSVVVVELARGASLHGVVKEGDRLLPDMDVRVAVRGEVLELGRGRTDAGGTFRFVGLPAADVYVMVSSARYEEKWLRLQLVGGQHHDVTITLEPGRTLRGQVVDDVTGTPILDAEVGDSWTFGRTVRTGADGRFTLAGLRDEGFVMLHVRAYGYATWSLDVAGTLGDERTVRLQRGGELVGRLVDAQGTPIVDGFVAVAVGIVHAPGMHGTDWLTAPVGPDGRFVALGLRPNRQYSVMARSPGRGARVYLLPRSIGAGVRHDVGDLVLLPAGGIEGRVVDDHGAPVVKAEVQVRGANADAESWASPGPASLPTQFTHREVVTDANGVFRIAGVAAGGYRVSASVPGLDDSEPREVAVEDGKIAEGVLVVVVRGLSLRGVMRRADGVALDAEQRDEVWLQAADPTGQTHSAQIDAQGGFTIQGLKPGKCSLMALRAPKGWSLAPMVVEAGASDLQLVLQASSFVSGQVVDADGKPLQAKITVWPEGGTGGSLLHATDAEGKFRVEVPPTFVGRVNARHPVDPFRGAELKDVRAGTSDLRMVVKPFGR